VASAASLGQLHNGSVSAANGEPHPEHHDSHRSGRTEHNRRRAEARVSQRGREGREPRSVRQQVDAQGVGTRANQGEEVTETVHREGERS
jgi:hypothetical protein